MPPGLIAERQMPTKVIVQTKRRLLNDFFKIDEAEILFEGYDNRLHGPFRRLVFERGDAVAALLFDKATAEIMLVEQFKYPTYEKGPGWIVETMAGMIESGETPEDALKREAREEVGYETSDFEHIATFYPSAGGSSERIFLYYVEVSSADKVEKGGGNPDEGEDIRLVRMPLEDFFTRLKAGAFVDGKIIAAGFWLLCRKRSLT